LKSNFDYCCAAGDVGIVFDAFCLGGVTHLKNRSCAVLFIVNLLQKYLAILIFNAKMQMLLF